MADRRLRRHLSQDKMNRSSMIMPVVAQFMRLLASVCVCSRQGFRMRAYVCVCVRMCASVCICSRLCASARVCVRLSHVGRLISRLCASVCVCLRLCASGVLSRVCVRLLVNACGNWLILCVGRLVSRLCASACGNWLILCVGRLVSRHSKSLKVGGTGSFHSNAQVFAICLASYYPLAVLLKFLILI